MRDCKKKPLETHHILTKYGEWGKRFNKILSKYGLDAEGAFNKIKVHHKGPHPPEYQSEMMRRVKRIDQEAGGDKDTFLKLFEKELAKYVEENQ